MDIKQVVDAIDRQSWLEPAARQIQAALRSAYRAGGPPGQSLKNFLHGTWLGHPLHAVLTDVPVGAWSAALVLDGAEAAGGQKALAAGADLAVMVGIAGAAGSALAGLTDWEDTDGRRARLGLVHAGLNTGALALYVASAVARKQGQRGWGRALALAGYAIVGASAYLGGELVYSLKTGVDHAESQALPERFVDVLAETELAADQPRQVDADGAPVVLVRRGARIYALADTCSHLGCSLAEGQVEGDSIRCSCHGSRYALADGRVLDGPSTYNQPRLDTRVRDGRIEVRKTRELEA